MNINHETVTAVVRLMVSLAVAMGTLFGFSIDADLAFNTAMVVATVAVIVWVWWKNNNVTQAAQEAQKMLDEIKTEEKEEEEL